MKKTLEKLFTDFEPQRKGTPLWQIKADSPAKCEISGPHG